MFSSDHNFLGQRWELLVNKMHVHPLTYCTRVGERFILIETDDHPLYLLTDPAFALVLITAKFSLCALNALLYLRLLCGRVLYYCVCFLLCIMKWSTLDLSLVSAHLRNTLIFLGLDLYEHMAVCLTLFLSLWPYIYIYSSLSLFGPIPKVHLVSPYALYFRCLQNHCKLVNAVY